MTPSHEAGAPTPTPTPGEEDARARLRRALVRPGRGQLVVAVLLAVVAGAAVMQVRLAGSEDDYSGMRQADLVQALNGLQSASSRTELEISELERTRESLLNDRSSRDAALAQAQEELAVLRVMSGAVPAVGPGVRIKVMLPEGSLSLTYLLDAIEELRDAGAEAIEFNDSIRVVAQTSFQESADGLHVDGTLLERPYLIDVIGDPDTLANAVSFPGGFADDVELDGGSIDVETKDRIEITALHERVAPRFAKPVE